MIVVERPSLLSRLRFSLPVFSFRRPVAKVCGQRVSMALSQGDTEIVKHPRPGMVVRCLEGELWITQDGDAKDVLLRPDESCVVRRGTQLMVHAVKAGGFELSFG
jgi:hypothetical protein